MPLRFLAASLVLLCACGSDTPRTALPPQDSTTADEAAIELIAGTPDGDLEQWVADMQRGLETMRSSLSGDRSALQRQVLDFYVGRQEYLEMYYGAGGRMSPTAGLATAVKSAEDRFHVLIQMTGSSTPAEEVDLKRAIDALDAQLKIVLQEAASSPKRLRASQSAGAELP
jgi:hypothetical protein